MLNWSGFGGNVNLEVWKGGTFWLYANTDVPGSGSQNLVTSGWELRSDYRVKVVLRTNASVFAWTNYASVSSPSVSVSPTSVTEGQTTYVNWSGFSGNVNLEVWKGGTFWLYANTNVSGSGSQALNTTGWEIRSDYRVKVVLRDNVSVNEYSNYFVVTASPTLTLLSPNGGESWEAGTTHTISWTSANVSGGIQIQPYLGGAPQTNIAASASNTGSYVWNIPPDYPPGTTYQIGISAMSGTVSDFSNGDFTITNPVTAAGFDYPFGPPNGAPRCPGTSQCAGGWQNVQDFGEFNTSVGASHLGEDWNLGFGSDDLGESIYAAADGVVTYAQDTGIGGWKGVIIIQHSGTFQVPGQGTVTDVTTMYAHLDVSSINSWVSNGSTVTRGQKIGEIGPTPSGSTGPHLHLEVRTDTGIVLGPGYSNDPTGWTDPSEFIDANRLVSEPVLTLTAPNGGECWVAGTTETITWTSSNVTGDIQIQPYVAGVPQTNLAAAAPNTGSLVWDIPAGYSTGTEYQIGISAMGGTVFDFSDADFKIGAGPELTLTSPNGGEDWPVGTTQTITWTSSNVTGDIQIQPYLGGVPQTNLAAAAANTGSFVWDIPAGYPTGTTYRIGISAMSGSVSDFSDADFTISASGGGVVFDRRSVWDNTIARDYDDLCGTGYSTDASDVVRVYTREQINRTGRTVARFVTDGMQCSSIASATLRLYAVFETEFVQNDFHVSRITEDWVSTDATWCDRSAGLAWSSNGVAFTDTGQATTSIPPLYGSGTFGPRGEWIEWDVTEIVRNWLLDGDPNFGFVVWQTPLGGHGRNQEIHFASREYADAYLTPQLVIEGVCPITSAESPEPEPGVVLLQNAPNPFRSTTAITYGLESPEFVELSVFDIAGRLVKRVYSGRREPGEYRETWDARDENGARVRDGVYFYRLRAGAVVRNQKMLLIR